MSCIFLQLIFYECFISVEVSGFEPLTPAMSRRYSNQLSYTSIKKNDEQRFCRFAAANIALPLTLIQIFNC